MREAARRLRAFTNQDVTVFVDLTHPADGLEPYERHLEAPAIRVAHPIVDMGTTTIPHMTRILDDIDAALAEERTVYVHCWGGVGRTGTVVGCWLVRHGLDEGDPLRRIARLRRDVDDVWRSSPETSAQCAMVTGWKRGH
jgi:protein-tyrosine phosphatase